MPDLHFGLLDATVLIASLLIGFLVSSRLIPESTQWN